MFGSPKVHVRKWMSKSLASWTYDVCTKSILHDIHKALPGASWASWRQFVAMWLHFPMSRAATSGPQPVRIGIMWHLVAKHGHFASGHLSNLSPLGKLVYLHKTCPIKDEENCQMHSTLANADMISEYKRD